MTTIGFITGSGFYRLAAGDVRRQGVETPFGTVEIEAVTLAGHRCLGLARHGDAHARLSSQVRHRANLWALREAGAEAVVASTAVGVLDTALPLGVPLVFDDLFFPANRLPGGEPATFFTESGDPERGHWIPRAPFSPFLRRVLVEAAPRCALRAVDGGCYGHVDGPRFNTRAEVAWLRAAGVAAVSQTCGPEAVLAGELEMPYALVGYGVNLAPGPGVAETPPQELAALLDRHREVVGRLFEAFLEALPAGARPPLDTGTLYRIEAPPEDPAGGR